MRLIVHITILLYTNYISTKECYKLVQYPRLEIKIIQIANLWQMKTTIIPVVIDVVELIRENN